MKAYWILMCGFLLVMSQMMFPQNLDELFEETCLLIGIANKSGSLPRTSQILRGGREITTTGTLKVLVVFVRFKDDTENTTYWPDYNVLPSWAQNIVDPSVPSNSIYTPYNLSDYFDRTSGGDGQGNMGDFKLVGDVYYVTTDKNRSEYGTSHGDVNREILNTLDSDFNVNFTNYDNWEFVKNGQLFNHEYKPGVGDGEVDYIFIFWRDLRFTSQNVLGIKTLYVGSMTLDGKTIRSSSGSTQFGYRNEGPYNSGFGNRSSILIPAHEMTHYILGDSHFNQQGTNRGNIQLFSLMTSNANFASSYSAFERYRAN